MRDDLSAYQSSFEVEVVRIMIIVIAGVSRSRPSPVVPELIFPWTPSSIFAHLVDPPPLLLQPNPHTKKQK